MLTNSVEALVGCIANSHRAAVAVQENYSFLILNAAKGGAAGEEDGKLAKDSLAYSHGRYCLPKSTLLPAAVLFRNFHFICFVAHVLSDNRQQTECSTLRVGGLGRAIAPLRAKIYKALAPNGGWRSSCSMPEGTQVGVLLLSNDLVAERHDTFAC
jgi:hypothetical protein